MTKSRGRPLKNVVIVDVLFLRSLKDLHRLTFASLAVSLGVAPVTVKRMFKDGRVDDATAYRLATIFGVPCERVCPGFGLTVPPGAVIHDDGETLYVRQDRDESAFLALQEQSVSLAFTGAILGAVAESMRGGLSRLRSETTGGEATIDCLFELVQTVDTVGGELDSKFTRYRNNWREIGDLSDGN